MATIPKVKVRITAPVRLKNERQTAYEFEPGEVLECYAERSCWRIASGGARDCYLYPNQAKQLS